MKLENSKGRTLDVDVLLIIKNKTKEYYVYACDNTFLHVGLKKKDSLIPLSDKEFDFVSKIINKIYL